MAKKENSNSFYTTHRIGATAYKIKVVFKDDGAETMAEKFYDLFAMKGPQSQNL